MTSDVKVSGLKELDQFLKQFTPRIEGNIMRGALRASAKVIYEEAKALAPVDDGDLKKSIRLKTKNKKGRVTASVVAGNKEAFYAHFVEYGTGSFYSGKGESIRRPYKISAKTKGSLFFGGKAFQSFTHPGIKPEPFMRPAFDSKQDESLKVFGDYLRKRIDREFKKQAKK